MADPEEKASRFLKKSKWGKILKQKDKHDDPSPVQRQATFTLNDDVADFLKPSTEKQMPKIDIAIAKRWPDAHEVRTADQASPAPQGLAFSKPKRRKGLTVGFVKTLPEIIGEGGDDALEPPREIGRMKAMVTRSVSDRRPGSIDQGQYPRSPPLPQLTKMPSPPMIQEEAFVAPPLKRAQTSHNEFSPPLQRKVASPPSEDVEPYRRSISRVATGFESYSTSIEHTTPLDMSVDKLGAVLDRQQLESNRPTSRDRPPQINTHFDQSNLDPLSQSALSYSNSSYSNTPASGLAPKQYMGLSPRDASSPIAQKRREMVAKEGAVFRRASMLMQQGQDDEDDSPPQSRDAQQPMTDSLSSTQPETLPPQSTRLTPESAVSPEGPNPFADPKYIKRRSREATPERAAPPQSFRQMGRDQMHVQDPAQLRDRNAVYSRERPGSGERQMPPPQQYGHQRAPSRDGVYANTVPPPQEMLSQRSPQQPAPQSQHMVVPETAPRETSRSPGLSHRYGSVNTPAEKPAGLYMRPNGSSTSFNQLSPGVSHSRTSSRDGTSSSLLHPTGSVSQQSLSPQSPRSQNLIYGLGSHEHGSKTSLLGPGRGTTPLGSSSKPRGSPDDYFANTKSSQPPPQKSAVSNLRQEDASGRPSSSGSTHSQRPSSSSHMPDQPNPAADAAFEDFASRIAHMKGVFRLTAEKELPGDRCSPSMWLRSGLWWYLKGKAGLEAQLQQRNPRESRRELLTQAHVDLAKAWWILSDPLEGYENAGQSTPQSAHPSQDPDAPLMHGVYALKSHLKSLSLSMDKNQLLPPTQSLIQGQDTRVWLEYPRFTSDAAAVLGGSTSTSLIVDEKRLSVDPYEILPLSDTQSSFCYGRFPVEVFVNTEQAETDRVMLPCTLTVLRGRRDYQTSIAIASQNELVSIKVSPARGEKKGMTWADVSWKASSFGIVIRLPRGFDLSVRMQERDFRAVWNLSEYARKVEKSLRAEPGEQLIYEARLAELQYADSSNSNAFPPDKIRGCMALIFESSIQHTDGHGMRKLHRGYRMLLITDPGHKTLSCVSHDVCKQVPLYFEFLTDSAANGTTAMVIRVREDKRQCRILLVFPDAQRRQALYDVLNGLNVGPDETVVGKMTLTSLNIEAASQTDGFSQSAHPVLQGLQWQKLGVTNGQPDDPNSRIPSTVLSDHLRVVARHATGCITDRLNLSKGELLIRLPVTEAPAVQILRQPQEDMTMSIDTRHSPPQVSDGIGQLLRSVLNQPTIRTFTFASQPDLHAFQTAITGLTVRYDGLASTLGISRRRMVVPIYKKWEASNVRLQIVSKDTVVQFIAFMEDFSHADSLCFQVKSTDVFETIKGDNKHKKWGVKLVDAKFSLPSKEKGDMSGDELLRRRYINLEGLDYAEEHDDITVGFDSEQERDRFAQALPAATSVSRGITLKRRI